MTLLKKILCHVLIVLGGMFLVFSIINFVNDAMNFINNEISLVLLLIWAALSMVAGGVFIADTLKKEAASSKASDSRRCKQSRSNSYESDLEEELEGLINVETRHEKKDEKNNDELDLFSLSDYDDASSTKPAKAKSEEKLTGAARYKRNRM